MFDRFIIVIVGFFGEAGCAGCTGRFWGLSIGLSYVGPSRQLRLN